MCQKNMLTHGLTTLTPLHHCTDTLSPKTGRKDRMLLLGDSCSSSGALGSFSRGLGTEPIAPENSEEVNYQERLLEPADSNAENVTLVVASARVSDGGAMAVQGECCMFCLCVVCGAVVWMIGVHCFWLGLMIGCISNALTPNLPTIF